MKALIRVGLTLLCLLERKLGINRSIQTGRSPVRSTNLASRERWLAEGPVAQACFRLARLSVITAATMTNPMTTG